MIFLIYLSLGFQMLGAFLAFRLTHVRRINRQRRRPITIIKPIKGWDAWSQKCIQSFLNLEDFPGDEIIFCFEDSGIEYLTVKSIASGHPNAKFTTGGSYQVVANPKINNIWNAYNFAKNNLVIISDQDVIAPHDYKIIMDQEFTAGTGILTSLCTSTGKGLDALMLNTFNAKWILLLNFFGQSTVVGKSMMFNKHILNAFGGLHEAGQYLAEDYAIGSMFRKRSCSIKMSSVPIRQSVSSRPFWSRYLRWGVMRKAHAPLGFLLEPIGYGFVTQTLAWTLLPWYEALAIGMVWSLLDSIIYESVSGGRMPWLSYTIREWSALPMWIQTLFTNKIDWKGSKYVVHRGGICTNAE